MLLKWSVVETELILPEKGETKGRSFTFNTEHYMLQIFYLTSTNLYEGAYALDSCHFLSDQQPEPASTA